MQKSKWERRTLRAQVAALAVLVAVASTQTGCVSGTQPMQQPVVIQPSQHPTVRQALLQPCDTTAAQAIPDGSLATMLANHVDVALALGACSVSKSDLIDAIKGQSGIDIVP